MNRLDGWEAAVPFDFGLAILLNLSMKDSDGVDDEGWLLVLTAKASISPIVGNLKNLRTVSSLNTAQYHNDDEKCWEQILKFGIPIDKRNV